MDIGTELLYASRMMVAALIGGLIGWERERHASDAGIRTYMAISIGACAFSLISAHVAANDPTRIAAQVVTGVLLYATLTLHHLPGWKRLSRKQDNQDDPE